VYEDVCETELSRMSVIRVEGKKSGNSTAGVCACIDLCHACMYAPVLMCVYIHVFMYM
jgi:hypothetical protein